VSGAGRGRGSVTGDKKESFDRSEKRCLCNRLICILRDGDIIEIKCSKCKRLIEIHTRGIIKIDVVSQHPTEAR